MPRVQPIDPEKASPEAKAAIEAHLAQGYRLTNEKLTLLHNVTAFEALEGQSYAVDRELQKIVGSRAADFCYESQEVLDRTQRIPGLPALWDTAEEPAWTLVVTLKERASEARLQLVYTVFERENVLARSARISVSGTEADRKSVV